MARGSVLFMKMVGIPVDTVTMLIYACLLNICMFIVRPTAGILDVFAHFT